MESNFLLASALGFLGGIGFMYVILRFRNVKVYNLDGHMLLLKTNILLWVILI